MHLVSWEHISPCPIGGSSEPWRIDHLKHVFPFWPEFRESCLKTHNSDAAIFTLGVNLFRAHGKTWQRLAVQQRHSTMCDRLPREECICQQIQQIIPPGLAYGKRLFLEIKHATACQWWIQLSGQLVSNSKKVWIYPIGYLNWTSISGIGCLNVLIVVIFGTPMYPKGGAITDGMCTSHNIDGTYFHQF